MTMADYSYRTYERSDADDAVALFSACFGKERSKDEWNWLYHSSPFGQMSVVCDLGDDMVGFYGVLSRPVFLKGRAALAGHVLDVMTHPKHQGKGIFSNCARHAFSESRRNGVNLFFGFPNKQAMPGHAKVNWRLLGTRQILRRAPLTNPLPGHDAPKEIVIRDVSWDSLSRSAEAVDRLNTRSVGGVGFRGDRSARWLKWRYGERPGFAYYAVLLSDESQGLAKGWMVLRSRIFQGRKVGHIVDYAVAPDREDLAESLVKHAMQRFSSEGCEFVQSLEDPHHRIQAGGDGVWETEADRGLPFIVRGTDADGSGTPTLDLCECYLTLGDCDVF